MTQTAFPLLGHSLLSPFITEDLLRNEHYAVTYARIKQRETDIDLAECLHNMAQSCQNVFSNAGLVNCFKQGPEKPHAQSLRTIFVKTSFDSPRLGPPKSVRLDGKD